MSERTNGAGALLCVTAALCVSAHAALTLTVVVSLLLIFVQAACQLLRYGRLPVPFWAVPLLSGGVGTALWLVLRAFLPDIALLLGAPLPVLTVFLLCGVAAVELAAGASVFRPSVLFRAAGALLVTGLVREVLAQGSLMGYPLPFPALSEGFGSAADGTVGVGGILVAAGVLWLFRLHAEARAVPLRLPFSAAAGMAAVTVTVCAAQMAMQAWFPAMTPLWRFWVCLLLTAVAVGVLLCLLKDGGQLSLWAVLPPLAAWLLPKEDAASALLGTVTAGAVVGLAVLAAAALRTRTRRVPRSFSGAPAALAASGLFAAALSPFL